MKVIYILHKMNIDNKNIKDMKIPKIVTAPTIGAINYTLKP